MVLWWGRGDRVPMVEVVNMRGYMVNIWGRGRLIKEDIRK